MNNAIEVAQARTGTLRRPKAKPAKTTTNDELRAALFNIVTFRNDENKTERTYAVGLYFRHLVNAAAAGNTSAHREMMALSNYIDRKELRKPSIDLENSALEAEWAQHEMNVSLLKRLRTLQFNWSRPFFHGAYDRLGVDLGNFDSFVIKLIDFTPFDGFIYTGMASKNPLSGGGGYGKPPIASQFKPGKSGNPSGKKKVVEGDVLAGLTEAMLTLIPVTNRAGQKTKITGIRAAGAQLIANAVKGKVGARKQLREIIISLDNKGLLLPIAAKKRLSKKSKLELREQYENTMANIGPGIFDQIAEIYRHAYGEIPADQLAALRLNCLPWDRSRKEAEPIGSGSA